MGSRVLSVHARYGCRHSGVCCRTGWDLPFKPEERLAAERLHLVAADAFREADGVSFAARRPGGACVFLETGTGSIQCGIHRAAGQDVLPVACRMFPRVALHDARGWTITLSHFCPTAASLLFEEDGPTHIGEALSPLMDVGPLEGLDATDAIPPLLREGVLMDLDSFSEWEAGAVSVLTGSDVSPEAALERLEQITDEVTRWTPGDGELCHHVRMMFLSAAPAMSCRTTRESRAVQRWLAAHLFGNWIAYQGRGLRTIVRYVRACLDVFTVELSRDGDTLEAIRRSDYLIVHESDSQQLATAIDALVRRSGTRP